MPDHLHNPQNLIESITKVVRCLEHVEQPVEVEQVDCRPSLAAIEEVAMRVKVWKREATQHLTNPVTLPEAVGHAIRLVASLAEVYATDLRANLVYHDDHVTRSMLTAIDVVAGLIPRLDSQRVGASRAPSVLRMARRHSDENLHSDLLGALLDSDRMGPLAFALYNSLVFAAFGVGCPPREAYQFAKREVPLGSISVKYDHSDVALRRIDLVVIRPSSVLVIENKIWSSESAGQTEDYANAIAAAYPSKARHCVLLSPYGTAPACEQFNGISYRVLYDSLIQSLSSAGDQHPAVATFYLAELEDLMRDFYS